MLFLLTIESIAMLILYLFSRAKYKEEVSLLSEESKVLKHLLPMGLWVMELIKHKYSSRYERRLETKLRDLNGSRNVRCFLKIHIASKVVIMLFTASFITFVGTQVEIDSSYFVFSLAVLGAIFYVTDKQLDDKVKQKRRSMQIEFPEFLNKLVLLVDAGLTVHSSIRKIIKDSTKSSKKNNPLYIELSIAINEIEAGKSEVEALEDFAKRCKLHEVTGFVASLIQNLRRGNDQLIPILRLQASSCWENRKNIARKLGEEASTKLLIPMMIIFVAILAMIMTPAVLQLRF